MQLLSPRCGLFSVRLGEASGLNSFDGSLAKNFEFVEGFW